MNLLKVHIDQIIIHEAAEGQGKMQECSEYSAHVTSSSTNYTPQIYKRTILGEMIWIVYKHNQGNEQSDIGGTIKSL